MTGRQRNVDIEIGRRIRERRMKLGMSQEWLGECVGITFQQIQKYEKGTNRVAGSRILQICGILGLKPGDLLDDLTHEESHIDPLTPMSRMALSFASDLDRIKDKGIRKQLAALVRQLAHGNDHEQDDRAASRGY